MFIKQSFISIDMGETDQKKEEPIKENNSEQKVDEDSVELKESSIDVSKEDTKLEEHSNKEEPEDKKPADEESKEEEKQETEEEIRTEKEEAKQEEEKPADEESKEDVQPESKEEDKTEEKQEIKEEVPEKEDVKDEVEKKSRFGFAGIAKSFSVLKRKKPKESNDESNAAKDETPKEKKPFKQSIKDFYDKKYKKLLIIPFALLLIALVVVGVQLAITGEFVKKDVSLKGGVTITVFTDKTIDIDDLEDYLDSKFPSSELSVRSLKQFGQSVGIIIDGTEDVDGEEVISALELKIDGIKQDDYSVTVMGSNLGETFFKEILKAIYISFLFMGIVIFWYFGEGTKVKILATILTLLTGILMFFGSQSVVKDVLAYIIGAILIMIYIRNSMPSFMVILNVFADVIVTLAIVNLIGMKLSTAGIAAFLMIVGYSVNTNILLSTKLLKRKEGEVIDRIFDAMKTGLTMTLTTLTAIIVALIFTQSSVIKQIMLILLIGLIVDMIYTWLQNAGILRLYLEKKGNKTQDDWVKKLFTKFMNIFRKKEQQNGQQS